jgi:phenylacetic acid degradation protein paaN
MPESLAERWFARWSDRLHAAAEANRLRHAYTPFIESPSRRLHPEGAPGAGRAAFEAQLGRPFDLDQPGEAGRVGAEVSPFTGEPLGITYPRADVAALYGGIAAAWPPWKRASRRARVGVCMELLERWSAQSFENAHATMHTAGQAFMLAFAGSGASALDRGLEATAAAWTAMQQVPERAAFSRPFGKGPPVHLDKRYRLVPVGVAVVLSCGSYPAWNAYPAILASLATGNPVVVKPHPDTILPVAIAVRTGRAVLAEAGFDPNLLTLACDTWDAPVAMALFDRPETRIIDFTGGQGFGRWIEQNQRDKQVYTETAGCNSVVLESAVDLDAALRAIAYGLVLFSAQMCTAPQNIWIPRTGVVDGGTLVPPDEVAARLVAAVDALVADPKVAAALCGALHSDKTVDEMAALRATAGDRVLRSGAPYAHPEHPGARTATPLLVRLDAADRGLCQREQFGPMGFLIEAEDRSAALAGATADAQRFGAIASYAYTTDAAWLETVLDAFADAGASVGVNLIRQRPMNFTAAFSDFHVTGLNPAGTACLTDPAFVARRFRVVQSKVELPGPVQPGDAAPQPPVASAT